MIWKRLLLTLDMIKFEHSVFALPFALTGALLAIRPEKPGSPLAWLAWGKILWIIVAMVGARSAAMAFNRLVDSGIDGRNPRTRMRHLPAGLLAKGVHLGIRGDFVRACSFSPRAELNPLCLHLAPLALAIVFIYSFTKRFTAFSHLVLGFSLGIAPAAAWIAVRGSLDPRILWLTAAVTFWTAGFDIIYSCQDYEFDVAEDLFSVPRLLGIARALRVAQLFHVLMVACLLMLVRELHLGALSVAGVGAVVALLLYEHSLVKAKRLVARERGLLHHERVREHVILFILGC